MAVVAAPDNSRGLGRIHALLAVQSILIVLLSINRLSTFTLAYVTPNQFLRWVDLLNMALPLLSIVSLFLLKHDLARRSSENLLSDRRYVTIGVWFALMVYIFGVSYGIHETTNYLHSRFCDPDPQSDLCRIIIFNDDEFSHWLFFGSFTVLNLLLMLVQVLVPNEKTPSTGDTALLMLNGLFIAAGIFANLAFEEIGLDLYVVAVIAAVAGYLRWRYGPRPLLVYYSTAYVVGFVLTTVKILLVPFKGS